MSVKLQRQDGSLIGSGGKILAPVYQKAGLLLKRIQKVNSPVPGGQEGRALGYPGALGFNDVCLVGFWTCSGPVLSSFLFLPFGMETFILCLFQYCILEAKNLFSFTELQLESNLSQEELYLDSHSYLI